MVKLLEKVGCLRLHTAGIVVGWLGVAGATVAIIIASCVLGFSDKLVDHMMGVPNDPDRHEATRSLVVIFGSIYLGGAIISGMVSGSLVYGTVKNRHSMLLPWLILHGIGIALKALTVLSATVSMFTGPIENTLKFFIVVLSFALYYYIYLGIYSLYKHIQTEKKMDRPVAAPVHQYSIYGKV